MPETAPNRAPNQPALLVGFSNPRTKCLIVIEVTNTTATRSGKKITFYVERSDRLTCTWSYLLVCSLLSATDSSLSSEYLIKNWQLNGRFFGCWLAPPPDPLWDQFPTDVGNKIAENLPWSCGWMIEQIFLPSISSLLYLMNCETLSVTYSTLPSWFKRNANPSNACEKK